MRSYSRRRPTSSTRFATIAFCAAATSLGSFAAPAARAEAEVVIVVGAGGTEEYAAQFSQWAERWQTVASSASANVAFIGPPPTTSDVPATGTTDVEDRQQLLALLGRLKSAESESPLWLVLIGHGTYQQGQAKFNLRGPDVSAEEFAEVLGGATRPLVIINSASASGPFLAALSGANRIVVTATRSGDEQNFARFGDYLSRAIGDLSNDLDHDASVSILESFLAASHQTRQFYEREGRLATEHALLDDNGDAKGTPADFFRGIRLVGQPADTAQLDGTAEPDGQFAAGISMLATPADLTLSPEQRKRITEIEHSVRGLRARKSEMETEEYYAKLEQLMVEMAELYEVGAGAEAVSDGG